MVHDLLAPFRLPGSIPAAKPEPEEAPKAAPQAEAPGYQAYGIASGTARPLRLEVRTAGGACFARSYASLTEIAYDRATYNDVMLLFLGKMVTLKGRNLQPVIEALIAGMCEFIVERAEGEQAQDSAPIIDKVTVVTPGVKAPTATLPATST